MPFIPGNSGNPGGRPKVEAPVRELARKHTKGFASRTASIDSRPAGTRSSSATWRSRRLNGVYKKERARSSAIMAARGRPKFEPTDVNRRRVEAMVGYGIPEHEIAKVIGVSPMTLRKYFREEIRVGATKANTQVAEFLFSTITGVTVPDRPPITDDRARVTAAIFWARTRMGWKDITVHEHIGKDGAPIKIDVRERFCFKIDRLHEALSRREAGSVAGAGAGDSHQESE
jgi:hypothetical protein